MRLFLRTTKYYSVLKKYYSVLLWLLTQPSFKLPTTKKLIIQPCACTAQKTHAHDPFCLLQYYSVLHSTTPVLLCTTQCYSSTTLYYKVLLQYYSVLQSTTPVLLCTTKYYSSTTLYYKVLLQYYSVLQSTTPVLLCTTKYYSSTTLYYSVLLQYYSVLLYKVLLQYYSVLLYKVLLQYYSVLQSTTSSTTLYYKILLQNYSVIDPWHKWNVIYNARSNMRHSPNSPNTAPATKNDRPKSQRNLLKTDETSFPMRGRSDHDPSMIRAWNRQSATRLATEVTFPTHHEHFVLKNTTFRAPAIIPNFTEYCACHEKWHLHFTKYCACHEKWISWLILDTNETLFTMRGATCVIVQTHQILRLPRKMNRTIDPWHKWNVIYNARSNMRHSPNSPNTAPATKNDRPKSQRNLLKTDETSEHDPSMKPSVRNPPRNRGDLSRPYHEHFVLKNTTFRAPAIIPNFTEYCACHEKWHLHFTKYCACHEKWISWLIPWHKWNVIYNARSNMRHSPNSPNTAPATKNESPDWSLTQMKRYLQCAEQHAS